MAVRMLVVDDLVLLLKNLSRKGAVSIIQALVLCPLTRSNLRKEVQLPDAVLDAALKGLQFSGLVARNQLSVMPPKVEYRLTKVGQSVVLKLEEINELVQNGKSSSKN
jgi:DNA-binding HxlR family transcriptional regulator